MGVLRHLFIRFRAQILQRGVGNSRIGLVFFVRLLTFCRGLRRLIVTNLDPRLSTASSSNGIPPCGIFICNAGNFLCLAFVLNRVTHLLQSSLSGINMTLASAYLVFRGFIVFRGLAGVYHGVVRVEITCRHFKRVRNILDHGVTVRYVSHPLRLIRLSVGKGGGQLRISSGNSAELPNEARFQNVQLKQARIFIYARDFRTNRVFVGIYVLFSPNFRCLVLLALLT